MTVFAAIRSVPDYHANSGALVSLHRTFQGAKKALYPEQDYNFIQSGTNPNVFTGPDGFGEIRRMEVVE